MAHSLGTRAANALGAHLHNTETVFVVCFAHDRVTCHQDSGAEGVADEGDKGVCLPKALITH